MSKNHTTSTECCHMKPINIEHCNHQYSPPPDRPLEGVELEVVDAMLAGMARPEAVIENVVAGAKFIALTAGGRMGLASLLGAKPKEDEQQLATELIGKTALQAAGLLKSASPFSISMGLAALNAANTTVLGTDDDKDAPADDIIVKLGQDKCVGLVGEFPFVQSLREKVGTLHLFELRDVPGAVPRDKWEETLAKLDVLALTGTAILTRQMGYFLTQAKAARIVVLGPSTPLSEALFDFGADYLCSSVVTDPERVAQGISEGISFQAVKRRGGVRFIQFSRP